MQTFQETFQRKSKQTKKASETLGVILPQELVLYCLIKTLDHNQEKWFLSVFLVAKKLLLQMQMSLVIPKKIDWTSAKWSRGAGGILLNAIQQNKYCQPSKIF